MISWVRQGAVAVALAVVCGASASAETFEYEVRPIVRADRTDLDVTLRWRPSTPGPQAVQLPQDCYGVPILHDSVASFEGRNGTGVEAGEAADRRVVTANRAGRIELSYRLSFDPEAMSHFPFGPNVGSTHFHVGGCQWLLVIGDDETQHTYDIHFRGRDRGWRYYSSMSADPAHVRRTASYDQMVVTALGGSAGPHHRFELEGKPVDVFWSAQLGAGFADVANDVERIVRGQRQAMRDNDFPFYTVAIWPRPEVSAGTAIDGLFVAFIKPDAEQDAVRRLLAHEMYHNWLSHRVRVEAEGAPRVRFQWLHEGVNEYLGRRLLNLSGMLSDAQMAELANRDLADIADNPYAAATLEQLEADSRARRWTNIHAKLAYARGAAIALRWEAELRREGGRDLVSFIRALHAGGGADAEAISPERLFEVGRDFGLDVAGDFHRYIVEGAELEAPADGYAGWRLETVQVPRFEPGLDVTQSSRTHRAVGVIENGPAWIAGLREGVAIADFENAGRFNNAWDRDAPLVVVLADARRVEYMPLGEQITVRRYVRAP